MNVKLKDGTVITIDRQDLPLILEYRWFYGAGRKYIGKNNYPRGTGQTLLHRLIMKTPKGFHTDHINGNTLDNRRSNLRICTAAQNQFNSRKNKTQTSKYKGVSWFERDKCWRAYINLNRRQIHLGYFLDEKLAAQAYNTKAKELYGKYAFFNSV